VDIQAKTKVIDCWK